MNLEQEIPQKEEKVFSPSQERINRLKQLKEEREKGILLGIPLWESFPSLAETIPTIDKGQVIMNAASSGIGKSMITRYKDIIVPWLYVKNHPELEIDLKFVIFLLEDDVDRFKDYVLSILLYLKYGIKISPKKLRSSYKNPLSQDIIEKCEELIPNMDDLLNRCTIEDSIYNTYGIYKKCRLLSEEWGTHYYVDMIRGENIIPRSEYNKLKILPIELREHSIQELKTSQQINPLEYKIFYKYSHYKANNPKQHVIAIFDNINCLEPDEKEKELKTAMDNFMYGYVRKNICKHWQWSAVAVQQFVGGAEEQAFTYKGNSIIEKLLPSLDKLGDSKFTQRACHLIYALFDPQRYGISEFMEYNIERLKDESRFLFILKNNDGECNKVTPLYFIGESSYFKELPKPKDMSDKVYKEIETKREVKIL